MYPAYVDIDWAKTIRSAMRLYSPRLRATASIRFIRPWMALTLSASPARHRKRPARMKAKPQLNNKEARIIRLYMEYNPLPQTAVFVNSSCTERSREHPFSQHRRSACRILKIPNTQRPLPKPIRLRKFRALFPAALGSLCRLVYL